MIDLRIKDRTLVTGADTKAEIEHGNSLFHDGLEDSFALPFTLPVRGNELALQHAQHIALKDRTLRFPGTTFGHQGVPLYPGTLRLLGSTPTQYNATFKVDDFTSLVRDLRLRDTLQGQVRDLIADLLNGIQFHTRPSYADGGDFQFPMHINRALYGDANPHWQPSSSPWNGSSSYNVNDLVTHYVEQHGVRRDAYWQCISPCPPGEGAPPNNTVRWALRALGVPNSWNASIGEHDLNTSDGNFHCLIPWYYLKWVLTKAMAYMGWSVEGSFFTDTRSHEILLANATTIDKPNEVSALQFFQVTKTTTETQIVTSTNNAWNYINMVWDFEDESSGTNQDPSNLWNNSTFTFSPSSAGTWQFRARWRLINSSTGQWIDPNYGQVVRMYLLDSSGNLVMPPFGVFDNGSTMREWAYIGQGTYNPQPSEEWVDVTGSYEFTAGDVGQNFRILLARFTHSWNQYGVDIPVWPNNGAQLGAGSILSGWLLDPVGTSVPDQYVTAARHVPDVTVGQLLVAVQSACNLRVVPDMHRRVLRMDIKNTRVHQMSGVGIDRSSMLLGPPALDHQRRKPGIRLHWDMPESSSDPQAGFTSGVVRLESELPTPSALGQRAWVTTSGRVFDSRFEDGEFYWGPTGWHVPDQITGDPTTAEAFTPSCRPLHMDQVSIDGKYYLVPVMDHEGTSAYFGNDAPFTDILLCDFAYITDYGATVTDVPGARSWGAAVDPDDDSGFNFLWQTNGATGLYPAHFQAWHEFLVYSEPVVLNCRPNHPFLLNRDWERPFTAHGQVYLIERLPVTYAARQPLLATNVLAWRVVPYLPTTVE